MVSSLQQYDAWLTDDGPAALVIREFLVPVEGTDGVVFPAGFAAAEGADRDRTKFQGGYNIDVPDSARPVENVCLIDSVGSQANRIESLFMRDKYRNLVPQIVITAGDRSINLLEAGHRAGDAVVRSTVFQADLHAAFKAALLGNCEPLAKIAPTSLVFGVWDSRNTQAKFPRLLSSTIRAYNVQRLTRSAQYVPAADYEREGLVPPADELNLPAKKYGERGFSHVPAPATAGGVIVHGGIRRDAILSLSALRLLTAGQDAQGTQALRRYILGLSLVALTGRQPSYLRQGCNLVPDVDQPRRFVLVQADGRRVDASVDQDEAFSFAAAAAEAFGVGEDRTVAFDRSLATKDLTGEGDAEKSKKAAKAKLEKK
jgi:CRISPR-associated protein Csb1